jgi:crotonobetainyl-CoA:carnitine CoA-transferase CaiB-like acyl-CoA transferase
MLGLAARHRTGQGQRVLVDMFGANAYANHDDFLAYPGKAARALPDPLLYGLSASYRLYRCARDQWVFLALTSEREFQRFSAELMEAGLMAPGAEALHAGSADLAETLASLFAQRDADSWETLLGHVGCVRADRHLPSEFWLEDAQAQAMGLTGEVTHPAWGTYRRHGAMVRFDGQAPVLGSPPLAGEHNQSLLRARGYSVEAIARLHEDGVLWAEHPS